MGKLKIPAIVLLVVLGVYLLSAAGTNACFRSLSRGHSASRASALFTLGKISIMTFRYEQAIDILDFALKKYPTHPAACKGLYNYGLCLEKTGLYREAINAYNKYLSTYPNDHRETKIINKINKLSAMHLGHAPLESVPRREGLRS